MRKISKSRVDDDVVSSTNGSLMNDDQPEPDRSNNDDDIHADLEANGGSGNDDEPLNTSSKKKVGSKSKRGRKKKADSENEYEVDAESEARSLDKDDEPLETSPSKKGASKSKRGRKKKADKEEKEDTEEEYEVDKVIDSKKIKGKLHYLIRWKGYSADSDTWEPEDTLSCPDLISKHHDEKDSKNKKESPSKAGKGRKRKSKQKETKSAKRPKSEWDSEKADENAEYEVERILEVHHKKSGKRDFLIHWKGWSSKFDSWEPEDHLNCPDLIKKFMDKVESARLTDTRNLRVAPESTNRFTLQTKDGGRRLSKRRGQRQRVRYDNAE